MKIFIVTPTLTNGGAERVAAMLAKGFSERGHEVTVVTHTNQKISYHPGPKVRLLPIAPDKINAVAKWITALVWFRKYIKEERPDVIIGIMAYCTYLARIAAVGTDTKIVLTEHSAFERIEGYPVKKKVKFLRNWINCRFRYVTVLTEQDKIAGGRKFKHAFVMPNPISFNPYQGDIQELKKEKYVLAVGRIYDWYVKGFDVLLEAWGIMVKKHSLDGDDFSWTLKIAGTGTEEGIAHLKGLCRDYHIQDSVEFLGFQENMIDIYRRAEIFCLSSRSEGLPMALLEAMSQGCAPVATSNLGRTAEIIRTSDEGLICEPANPYDLADKLYYLIRIEKDDLKKIQKNAIERSCFFSLDNIIDRWENFISQM